MEDFGKYIVSKIQHPILINTFIGAIYWNKHTFWTCFFIGKEDFYTPTPVFNKQLVLNKLDLISRVYNTYDKIEFCCIDLNLLIIPLLTALGINILLPYVKSFFKAIEENAGLFLNQLRVRFNRIKTVPQSVHDGLKEQFKRVTESLEEYEERYNNLLITNRNLKQDLNSSENANKVINVDIERLGNTLSGTWHFKYEFVEPDNNHHNGEEFFRIDGDNYKVNNKPDGNYNLRGKLVGLSYETSRTDFLERFVFIKKMFKLEKGAEIPSPYEFSVCIWETTSGNIFRGKELYTQDGGRTFKEAMVYGAQKALSPPEIA